MPKNSENNNFAEEDWQNWSAFWNLILQEDMKQNPNFYKKINKLFPNCSSNPNGEDEQEEKPKQNEKINKKRNP